MTTPLPAAIVDYFAQREAQRADDVNTILATLTDRERLLVNQHQEKP